MNDILYPGCWTGDLLFVLVLTAYKYVIPMYDYYFYIIIVYKYYTNTRYNICIGRI